jgi:hypothetical protein
MNYTFELCLSEAEWATETFSICHEQCILNRTFSIQLWKCQYTTGWFNCSEAVHDSLCSPPHRPNSIMKSSHMLSTIWYFVFLVSKFGHVHDGATEYGIRVRLRYEFVLYRKHWRVRPLVDSNSKSRSDWTLFVFVWQGYAEHRSPIWPNFRRTSDFLLFMFGWFCLISVSFQCSYIQLRPR